MKHHKPILALVGVLCPEGHAVAESIPSTATSSVIVKPAFDAAIVFKITLK